MAISVNGRTAIYDRVKMERRTQNGTCFSQYAENKEVSEYPLSKEELLKKENLSTNTNLSENADTPVMTVRGSKLFLHLTGKTAPYSELADENGVIEYNGVILQCDFDENALCLGDCSDPKNVLSVPLSNGGVFKFNRDNMGDISKIISMFSPEDRYLIMRAITLDKQCQKNLNEIEEQTSKTGETDNCSEETSQKTAEKEELPQK